MKYLLFILLFAPLSLSAQYRYSYTEAGVDSSDYELNVRENFIIIGIGQGNPLVIPFDEMYFDLRTGKNVATGHWTVIWDEHTLVCSERNVLRFVLTDRDATRVNFGQTVQKRMKTLYK